MRAYRFPEFDQPVYDCRGKDVVVVGGGNTAMDSVRTALRLGARRASLVYRRGEERCPPAPRKLHHAKDEGIELRMLTNPIEMIGDERGSVTGVRCVRWSSASPMPTAAAAPSPSRIRARH